MSEDIISIKTRQLFREYMVNWVLREIADAFDAARILCDLSYDPPVHGQRRALVERYYKAIEWSDGGQVARVLKVFESVLYESERLANDDANNDKERSTEVFDKLKWGLGCDGFHWTGRRIVRNAGTSTLDDLKEVAATFDAKHLIEQIARIEGSIDADPSLAIGTSKELIETCCRTILSERGQPVEGSPDVQTLTKMTLKELNLVPEGISKSVKGADVVKRILSNLGSIGNGLGELRNLYGTGHGKDGKAVGLKPRHARLAVGAAATLTTFLFATHEETK
ncbi:abortive infection family protein [Ruficoccus sp. ZRK36]|uniref:abortive infection family protein n=1 Tax=Ruficoccus sp. ZRK36 TaxID=2866311 RepID=UPI001C7389BB|nr:abortive infection family protein [Ruficoccus sp. ZRK36]QYY36870.1 abortive infection family protein [Ruficoccus sp. ZRK36]